MSIVRVESKKKNLPWRLLRFLSIIHPLGIYFFSKKPHINMLWMLWGIRYMYILRNNISAGITLFLKLVSQTFLWFRSCFIKTCIIRREQKKTTYIDGFFVFYQSFIPLAYISTGYFRNNAIPNLNSWIIHVFKKQERNHKNILIRCLTL
jgi:hypothetical protein